MEEFHVSRQTVRRALSELIHKGLAEARQGSGVFAVLPEKKRRKIAFITFALDSYIFPEIIMGISDVLHAKECDLLLYHTGYNRETEARILHSLNDVDGIIITPCYSAQGKTNTEILESIEQSGIPVMLLDSSFPPERFSSVAVNDREGGKIAAKELYDHGHRKITILYGEEHFGMVQRMEGAVAFFDRQGLDTQNYISLVSCSLQNPDKKIKEWIESPSPQNATAVFCTNDQLAFKVITEAEKQNISIPEKLSVIGFDDSERAEISKKPFSSIKHPAFAAGRIAAQLILEQLHTLNPDTHSTTVLSPRLVRRNSVKKI